MSNTDEKAGATPRTDALVESLAYAGSDAAQAVKDARGRHWEQWEAGANARFDAFVKMAYHARTLERELAAKTEEFERRDAERIAKWATAEAKQRERAERAESAETALSRAREETREACESIVRNYLLALCQAEMIVRLDKGSVTDESAKTFHDIRGMFENCINEIHALALPGHAAPQDSPAILSQHGTAADTAGAAPSTTPGRGGEE